MIKQRGDWPILIGAPAQKSGQSIGLAGSRDQQKDRPRLSNCPQPYGEAASWDFGIRVEQAVLCLPGGLRQSNLASDRFPVAARLVKSHMPIGAETENREVESAGGRDRLVEVSALCCEIQSIAVQQPYLSGLDRQRSQQVLPQEGAIAAWIVFRLAYEFIQIEEPCAVARQSAGPLQSGKMSIEAERRIPGRQRDCCIGFGFQQGGNDCGGALRQFR